MQMRACSRRGHIGTHHVRQKNTPTRKVRDAFLIFLHITKNALIGACPVQGPARRGGRLAHRRLAQWSPAPKRPSRVPSHRPCQDTAVAWSRNALKTRGPRRASRLCRSTTRQRIAWSRGYGVRAATCRACHTTSVRTRAKVRHTQRAVSRAARQMVRMALSKVPAARRTLRHAAARIAC